MRVTFQGVTHWQGQAGQDIDDVELPLLRRINNPQSLDEAFDYESETRKYRNIVYPDGRVAVMHQVGEQAPEALLLTDGDARDVFDVNTYPPIDDEGTDEAFV